MLVALVLLGVGLGEAGGWRCLDLLSDAFGRDLEGGVLGDFVQVAAKILVGY